MLIVKPAEDFRRTSMNQARVKYGEEYNKVFDLIKGAANDGLFKVAIDADNFNPQLIVLLKYDGFNVIQEFIYDKEGNRALHHIIFW